jgi:hypothetical protein
MSYKMTQGTVGDPMPSYREASFSRLLCRSNMLELNISFPKSNDDLSAETAETLQKRGSAMII